VKVSGFNKAEIALLGCLLRSAPLMQTMTLYLPVCPRFIHDKIFLKQLLGLNRSSPKAAVLIIEKHGERCGLCRPSSDDEVAPSLDGE